MAGGSCLQTPNPNLSPLDMLMEVFSWLPGKSLMRFKSVSKHYCSLITHPVFVEMHQTHSYVRDTGTFLVNFPWGYLNRFGRFYIVNIKEAEAETDTGSGAKIIPHYLPSVWPLMPDNNIMETNIVNGFICFYDRFSYNKDERISLYNLTTRKILSLPAPPRRTNNIPARKCLLYLGFDPTTEEYKVVCISRSDRQSEYNYDGNDVSVYCDVLDVGSKNLRWRPIDMSYIDADGFSFLKGQLSNKNSLCVDGVVYWTSWDMKFEKIAVVGFDLKLMKFEKIAVVGFDLKLEKFDFIKYPRKEFYGATLAHFGGYVSLVLVDAPCSVKDGKYQITSCQLMDGKSSDKPLWLEQVTIFQFPAGGRGELMDATCNCSGQVFLVPRSLSDEGTVHVVCCDLDTGKCKELRIYNARRLLSEGFCPSLVVENIGPLTK